jgi:hypothetical protein
VPVLLCVAGAVDRPDPVPAWRALSPGLEARVWPADHYSIMAGGTQQAVVERIARWAGQVAG